MSKLSGLLVGSSKTSGMVRFGEAFFAEPERLRLELYFLDFIEIIQPGIHSITTLGLVYGETLSF